MRFFFYGTLIAGSDNAVANLIHARLRELGPATVKGRLFAIPTGQGWYPALIAEPGAAMVRGITYEALPSFGAKYLALLDDYEAYRPECPDESDYLRTSVQTLRDGRRERAQAYVYHAALPPEARSVPRGDFRAFLKHIGAPPYSVSAHEFGKTSARSRRE
jgi:gamma-glutamylcyclotransferase (GGCT)/AIG2-like uncharacterized protein YtfP